MSAALKRSSAYFIRRSNPSIGPIGAVSTFLATIPSLISKQQDIRRQQQQQQQQQHRQLNTLDTNTSQPSTSEAVLDEASQLLKHHHRDSTNALHQLDTSQRARRALIVLDDTAASFPSSSASSLSSPASSSTKPLIDRQAHLLRIRALARTHNVSDALSTLHQLLDTQSTITYRRKSFPDTLILNALTAFIEESAAMLPSNDLLQLILDEDLLRRSRVDMVLQTPTIRRPFGYADHIKPLYRALFKLPLKNHASVVESDMHAEMLMIIANAREGYASTAHFIYETLVSRSLHISESTARALMSRLIKKNDTNSAKTVYYTLNTPSEETRKTISRAYARDGDVESLNQLTSSEVSDTTRLVAFAERGDLVQAMEVYHSLNHPSDKDKQGILTCYVRLDDVEGALSWIRKVGVSGAVMKKRGIYSKLLSLFVKRIDVESAMEIDQLMRDEGVALHADHYAQLIKLYAKRHDADMAERMLAQMRSEHIKPTIECWSALMNAHTNANNWNKVIDIYKHICQHYTLNRIICNTLIKAYVMLGSAFGNVLAVVKDMLSMGIRADETTFALVMQSAADLGKIDAAVSLFEEHVKWHSNGLLRKPNVVHYTVLIAAMLRVGQLSEARVWYNKMKDQNIQPDSITYGVIIASYLGREGEENVKVAKVTLSNLLGQDVMADRAGWMEKKRSKEHTLSNVLKPFLQNYGKRFTPELAQETFDYMSQVTGDSGNMENMTMLMDSYRRVGNHEVVNDIWKSILNAASEKKHARNALCLPLSIYIDSLTAQERLADLHDTFKVVKERGFAFDAHNWNHLAVALNKLGDTSLAFGVLERIYRVYEMKRRRSVYSGVANVDEQDDDTTQPNRSAIRRTNTIGMRQDRDRGVDSSDMRLQASGDPHSDLLKYMDDIEVEGGNHMNWEPHHRTLESLSETLQSMSEEDATQLYLHVAPASTTPANGQPAQQSPPIAQTAPLNVNKEASPSVSNIVRKKLGGFVGFANLPNQVHRKSVRKGFSFTCMVVGESGLGKSTLVNTLFETSLYQPKTLPELGSEQSSTVGIENISADIEENGVRLKLTVVDTPGFGDFVNNDSSWDPIVTSIESRFDQFLEQENRVNRAKLNDNRVNACIYFIQPTGHSLRQVDIEFMRRLHTKVNLIPVIAKSDTLSEEEVESFKRRILADIDHHKIQIFKAPAYEQEDEETIQENSEIESKIPFAIVGSTQTIQTADGRNVRGRSYPWGVVEVDNEEHCDFTKLRQMIIRTHMEELKESTNILYENYRSEKLLAMGVQQDASVFKEVNPTAKAIEEKTLHDAKLAKMEAEMKLVFQQKVQEKEAKLRQSEEELYARHREMKESLEKQRGELEDKRRRLESASMKWLRSKTELLIDKYVEDKTETGLIEISQSINEDNVKDVIKSIKGRMRTEYLEMETLILWLVDIEIFAKALNNSKNISFIVDYNELFIKLYLKLRHSNHLIVEAFEHKYQSVLEISEDGSFEHSYTTAQVDVINLINSVQLSLELVNNSLIYNKLNSDEFKDGMDNCMRFYNSYKDSLDDLELTAITSRNMRNQKLDFSIECYRIARLLDDYKDTYTPDEYIHHSTKMLCHEIENSIKEYHQLSLHIQQDEELQRVTEQSIQETRFDRAQDQTYDHSFEIPSKRSYDDTVSSPSIEVSSKQSFNFDRVPYSTSIPFNLVDNKMSTYTPKAFELAMQGKQASSRQSKDTTDSDIPVSATPVITHKTLEKRRQVDDYQLMDRMPSSQSEEYYYASSQIQDDIEYDDSVLQDDEQVDELDEVSPYGGIVESTTPTGTHF
ncbi:hypothetical protein E3P99_01388 [Wallemia hederae]|uniref:Septin-type G domain-containing protein n=1 Tax=Wallemia hederae TaxID=1540922 RepID=A0A4T0FQP6_9BASI|nr:hypothetical protein E3P99_01388 [Wallemia hederae]